MYDSTTIFLSQKDGLHAPSSLGWVACWVAWALERIPIRLSVSCCFFSQASFFSCWLFFTTSNSSWCFLYISSNPLSCASSLTTNSPNAYKLRKHNNVLHLNEMKTYKIKTYNSTTKKHIIIYQITNLSTLLTRFAGKQMGQWYGILVWQNKKTQTCIKIASQNNLHGSLLHF